MSTVIESIERAQLRTGLPKFDPGDRVRVHFQVIEGTRKRTQVFEGIVIRRQGSGARETFTVRKQSFGVGVERTFPLHSPKIERLEIASRGAVRRAKLYYLRGRIGKAARVAERRWGIDEDLLGSTKIDGDTALNLDGEAQDDLEATAVATDEVPAAGESSTGEKPEVDQASAGAETAVEDAPGESESDDSDDSGKEET